MSSSSNKMFINTQFSISQFALTHPHLAKKTDGQLEMGDSMMSMPNLGANREKSKRVKL